MSILKGALLTDVPSAEKQAEWDDKVPLKDVVFDLDEVTDDGVYWYISWIEGGEIGRSHSEIVEVVQPKNGDIIQYKGNQYRTLSYGSWTEWKTYQNTILDRHTTIINPAEGQMAWNTSTHKPVWYNGTAWIYADDTEV